jgi:pyridoxine 4-dehydrogenase
MSTIDATDTFLLGDRLVRRLGYGAMQLAGPGVVGPPANRAESLAVLRDAVACGVNHIDTSDFYGPHVTNELICEALYPYPKDLVIVTKIGVRRGKDGARLPATSPIQLKRAVHDNLRNLRLDALDVVNLRMMIDDFGPAEGSIGPALAVLAGLQQQGLVRHIGLSNVTSSQISEGRRMCNIVCIQNHYNLAHRSDDALIDELCHNGIAFVPYSPLGGFTPPTSSVLFQIASRLGVAPTQVALAWLLRRAKNILLIPGTSSRIHLRENLAAAELALPVSAVDTLNTLAQGSELTLETL